MSKRKKRNHTHSPSPLWLGLVAALLLLGGGGFMLWQQGHQPSEAAAGVIQPARYVDGLDGKALYEAHCAACHGVAMEGQPNWRQPDENGVLPAPPHDNTGHTWHHSDAVLLRIIREGGSLPTSAMPGYAASLTEAEMVAILAYIKTYWSQRELTFQTEVTQQEMRITNE